VPNPSFILMVPVGPERELAAQVIQSMAKKAGFDVKLQVTEFARALDMAMQGKMQASPWSRVFVPYSGSPDYYGFTTARHFGPNHRSIQCMARSRITSAAHG
jgi:ABC-type transport system substrate-binding protein